MSTTCIAERNACVLRVTRLGADCAPLTGPTDGAIMAAIATINMTQDVQEGIKYEPVDACGTLVYTAEDPDTIKRLNLTLELHKADFEGTELMTDAALVLNGDGDTIGVSSPGPLTVHKNGVMLEVWTKTAGGQGQCSSDGTPPYARHIFPRVLLRPGDRTFEGAPASHSFSGYGNANPQWEDVWSDYPGVVGSFDFKSPHIGPLLDPAGLPAAACGYVTPGASS